jgi:hypothetical protein
MRALVHSISGVLMAVFTIDTIKVNTLIEPFIHTSENQSLKSLKVLRVSHTDILNVASVAHMEHLVFSILLLKGSDRLTNVHMEAVSEVLSKLVISGVLSILFSLYTT